MATDPGHTFNTAPAASSAANVSTQFMIPHGLQLYTPSSQQSIVMVSNNGGSNAITFNSPHPLPYMQGPMYVASNGSQMPCNMPQKVQWITVPQTSPAVTFPKQPIDNQSTPGTTHGSVRSNPLNDFAEAFPVRSKSPKLHAGNSSPSTSAPIPHEDRDSTLFTTVNVQMNVDSAPSRQVQIYQIPSFQSNHPNSWPSGTQVYTQIDGTKFLSSQPTANMVFVPSSSLAQPHMINAGHQNPVHVFQMQLAQPQMDSSVIFQQSPAYSTGGGATSSQPAEQTPQIPQIPTLIPPTLTGTSGLSKNSRGFIPAMIPDGNDPKGKRKRSAFVEELRFCGMHKDSMFIRVWMDSFGKIFYDCICGGRKGVQDIKKIERHIATHQVAKHKCDECGKSFPRYLQLNAHKRVHRNRNIPTQQSKPYETLNGTAPELAAVEEEELDEQTNYGD